MMKRVVNLLAMAIVISLPIATSEAQQIERNAYFGDLHVHTSWSFDAYISGVQTNPKDAYQYAIGQEIPLFGGGTTKIDRPLDFMAVTDHAEFLGVLRFAGDPNHPISKHPLAKAIESGNKMAARFAFLRLTAAAARGETSIDESYLKDPDELANLWTEMAATADEFYRPGEFTTFAAFEWSSLNKFINLHRNVIFRDTKNLPRQPYSMLDSYKPEDLWEWMDKQRANGVTLLAIPHNANMSKGRMYPNNDSFGNPVDRKYAEARRRNEPVNEVIQIKGQSMIHSKLDATDEFAEFELFNFTVGSAAAELTNVFPGSYARPGLGTGLKLKKKIGINPFQFGLIGSSDSHNANSPAAENNYTGSSGSFDTLMKDRLSSKDPKIIKRGSGGLAGVWAEENTREAIFDAIARKETFATSGPRIRVRFFAGYKFQEAHDSIKAMAADGYANGVPMGGELSASDSAGSPDFLVWAVKDPDSANLDRVQIIKGWMEEGESKEKIFNVVLSDDRQIATDGSAPNNGAKVDLKTGEYSSDVGDVNLHARWSDPEFDATQEAFYIVRVIENPTPRWSTLQSIQLEMELSDAVPAVVQERAWSSPIWYSPK